MNHPAEILRAIDHGALVAISHSGGKDSDAATIEMLKITPPEQVLILHATLGESEWPGALELAQARAEHFGTVFRVTRAKKTFLEMVEHRLQTRPEVPCWPSPAIRQCTSNLKRTGLESTVKTYAREHHFTSVINVTGLRAEESDNRAGQVPCMFNARLSLLPRVFKNGNTTPGRIWHDYLPIHGMVKEDVFGTISAAGLKPHHAYALGNTRVSCILCIMGCRSDLRNGALHNPNIYRKYAALEVRSGYTFHPSRKTLPEMTGVRLEKDEQQMPDRVRRGSTQPTLL